MHSLKQRLPYAEALVIAQAIRKLLAPYCEIIEIAGSLRRKKASVGDVELVYVPRFCSEKDGLFDTKQVNLVDRELDQLLAVGVLEKRKNVRGSEVWGEKNKLALHPSSRFPVDLFQTTSRCWWNYLTCRTGGAQSNTNVAIAAIKCGLTWHPYSYGFSRKGEDVISFPVKAEADVFRIAGLPYLAPEKRP